MERLVGTDTPGDAGGGSYIFGGKWTCIKSGILSEFRVYTLPVFPGNVKVAVYEYGSDDSATGTRIAVNNSGVACGEEQWNSISIPPVALVQGNVYWLCALPDDYGVICGLTGVGQDFRETSTPYASGLPSIVTWDDNFEYELAYSGYGTPSGMSPMMMRTL